MVPCSRNYRSGNRNVRCEGRARDSAGMRVGETGQCGGGGGGVDGTVQG